MAAAADPAAGLGFSGFVLGTLPEGSEALETVAVFQGASQFRARHRDGVWGASARGLAIGTGSSGGEEVPVFTRFWLHQTAEGSGACACTRCSTAPRSPAPILRDPARRRDRHGGALPALSAGGSPRSASRRSNSMHSSAAPAGRRRRPARRGARQRRAADRHRARRAAVAAARPTRPRCSSRASSTTTRAASASPSAARTFDHFGDPARGSSGAPRSGSSRWATGGAGRWCWSRSRCRARSTTTSSPSGGRGDPLAAGGRLRLRLRR
jgi:hypothetical protein